MGLKMLLLWTQITNWHAQICLVCSERGLVWIPWPNSRIGSIWLVLTLYPCLYLVFSDIDSALLFSMITCYLWISLTVSFPTGTLSPSTMFWTYICRALNPLTGVPHLGSVFAWLFLNSGVWLRKGLENSGSLFLKEKKKRKLLSFGEIWAQYWLMGVSIHYLFHIGIMRDQQSLKCNPWKHHGTWVLWKIWL